MSKLSFSRDSDSSMAYSASPAMGRCCGTAVSPEGWGARRHPPFSCAAARHTTRPFGRAPRQFRVSTPAANKMHWQQDQRSPAPTLLWGGQPCLRPEPQLCPNDQNFGFKLKRPNHSSPPFSEWSNSVSGMTLSCADKGPTEMTKLKRPNCSSPPFSGSTPPQVSPVQTTAQPKEPKCSSPPFSE